MIDDIPEATREGFSISHKPIKKAPTRLLFLIGLMIMGAIVFGLISFIRPEFNTTPDQVLGDQKPKESIVNKVDPPLVGSESKSSISEADPQPKSPVKDDLLGHLPYTEANPDDLVAVTSDGRIKLHQSTATRFREMQAAAKAEGVNLVILSGFRDVESQNYLFFKVKEQRVQATAKRAEVSAPPGHSEHHTGYALDFGDAGFPATHLETSFEETPVFKWLAKNAPKYSFELSFPRDNPQGISYEPWHWRFVGDRPSLETFYKARNF